MSGAEQLDRKAQLRRLLIERLNEKEKLIGPHSPARGGQMSEEELAAEIEKLAWWQGPGSDGYKNTAQPPQWNYRLTDRPESNYRGTK